MNVGKARGALETFISLINAVLFWWYVYCFVWSFLMWLWFALLCIWMHHTNAWLQVLVQLSFAHATGMYLLSVYWFLCWMIFNNEINPYTFEKKYRTWELFLELSCTLFLKPTWCTLVVKDTGGWKPWFMGFFPFLTRSYFAIHFKWWVLTSTNMSC